MTLASTNRKPYRVYALVDPITGFPFYVGQTAASLGERRVGHLRKLSGTAKADRVGEIVASGRELQIVLIEEFVGYRRRAYERETYWINRLRAEGHTLLNHPQPKE